MKPSLTDRICTRCGLCCDGSLFADVELASGAEALAMEALGLEIEDGDGDDGGLLLQPCAALKGKRCSIYPYRPDCCRTFECRLLQRVKLGVVDVRWATEQIAEALARIERVKELTGQLGPVDKSSFIYRAYSTYDKPLTITSPPSGIPGGAYECGAGSDVPVTVDESQFPNWKKLTFYDGAKKLGEITQGTPEFTAKNLTPGYHVFSVLGTGAAGDIRPSNPVLVVVRR